MIPIRRTINGFSALNTESVFEDERSATNLSMNRFLLLCTLGYLALASSKTRTQSPAILPVQRAFMGRAELPFSSPTPGSRVHYTTDQSDPTLHSPAMPANNTAFKLVIDTPGSHTVKAIAAADGMVSSDIVLKRLEVFSQMEAPALRPDRAGRYDLPLNLTVADPSICSVDYLELEICLEVTKNGVRGTVTCMPCSAHMLLEDIGTYSLAAHYSIDDLAVSKTRTMKYTLTRPPFDTKPVYVNRKAPFQFKPKVDVFSVSKDLPPPRIGCSGRNVRGHHVILHNPLGHFDVLPPAAGCGVGLSLPSETSHKYGAADSGDTTRQFFQNPNYKHLIEKLSKEDVSRWRREHSASVANGDSSCAVATNAGFFDILNFNCLGNIVSQGKTLQTSSSHNVNFGIRNGSFVIGYVDVESPLKTGDKNTHAHSGSSGFDTLVSGLVWLVRGGKSYVADSIAPAEGKGKIGDGEDMSIQTNGPDFVNILSARTAIGYDSFGRLMMAQVEGESFVRGMDLNEFSFFLVELGFESAINLDGGGSATTTAFNTLVTEPSWKCTAEDIAAHQAAQDDDLEDSSAAAGYRVCEKPVSSITCIHGMPPPGDELLLPSQITVAASAAPSVAPTVAAVTRAPSAAQIFPTTGGEDEDTAVDTYSASELTYMEYQLVIYEYCTYGFAILLVLSLTANGWWAVSYNTLKRQQAIVPSDQGQHTAGAGSSAATAAYNRELELSSSTRMGGHSTRPGPVKYETEEYDDFEANYDSDDGNDSYDDEAALMSPPSKGRRQGRGGGATGFNPFQRR